MGGLSLKQKKYLLDTHALFYWVEEGEEVSADFIKFFDKQSRRGRVLVSTASIWEIAMLNKKGRVAIDDLHLWTDEIVNQSSAGIVETTVADMINSTLLPDYHKDPFDRLLIAQANRNNAILVTRDKVIARYAVQTFWM